MGMTMTQKIIAHHCGLSEVQVGQLVNTDVDLVLGNDLTTPVAIQQFNRVKNKKVFDRRKIVIVLDHFVPAKDVASAQQCVICRKFAKEHNLQYLFDIGDMGIEHVLLPEKGLVKAGDLIIGADSHTCTYGALGAFSAGVGSTDMAAIMLTGKVWLKVPPSIKFNLVGEPAKWVTGKDIILSIIGQIGVDGALYCSMEFTGEGIQHLTIDDRFTICNMAIEAGAKNAIFPVDHLTIDYFKEHVFKEYYIYNSDIDAEYEQDITINLSEIKPVVAFPHLPENVREVGSFGDIKIDQVVIGSCTNGRLSDLKIAADILIGKKVAPNVRVIIIPATQKIYLEAMKAGYLEIFINAGCVVSTPTCGPCIGGFMGILGDGERALTTTNRNFKGRMGHMNSEVYLANPAIAAASALTGIISLPGEVPN